MNFLQVVGQQAAKTGLLNMWQRDVFPHALMLIGSEGTGGLPMALALAQYVFCENKSATDSCGHCPNCGKVAKLEHADLHLSFPSIPPKPGSKALSKHFHKQFRDFVQQTPYGTTYDWLQFINAENKQGNITAEECRDIIDMLNLKSYEGGSKVQIIWRPEYLGKEGNILLKLVEEPPKNTIIIFVAEQADEVLATIRSRTQTVRLAPLNAEEIAGPLSTATGIDYGKALQVGAIAQGNYTEALRLAAHAENDLFPAVKDLFNGLFTNNGIQLVRFAEEWAKNGREQQKNFLQYIIQLLEQAIRARYSPGLPLSLPEAEAAFVRKLAATQVTLEAFGQLTECLTDTIYHIERNAHGKTQLLAMTIKMQHYIKGKPLPV